MKTLLCRFSFRSRCALNFVCTVVLGCNVVEGFSVPQSVGLWAAFNRNIRSSCHLHRTHPRCRKTVLCTQMSGSSNDAFDIQISTVMGIEAVTKRELEDLGYPDSLARNGRVEFRAGAEAIARCNIGLRSATRVLIKLGEFQAATFDELFDGVYAIPWGDVIHAGAAFPVRGKSVRSQLHSVPACQSIVKKAITKKLLTLRGQDPDHDDSWLEENERRGVCQIEVALLKDVVTISLDTSGDALAKRGYRPGILQGGAPLKETLAASMLLLSRWTPDRPLYDPFCGSGTILLEAALMAKNIAPGLKRTFAAEDCPLVCGRDVWRAAFEEAEAAVVRGSGQRGLIFGSDMDERAVDMTYQHLSAAGLDSLVQLSVADIHRVPMPPGDYGCVVTNPPYGERLDDSQRANQGLRRLMEGLDSWSLFALSGDDYLEADVGKRASKRRKLYNGKLPCQLYQYFGPLPPRERRSDDRRDGGGEEGEEEVSRGEEEGETSARGGQTRTREDGGGGRGRREGGGRGRGGRPERAGYGRRVGGGETRMSMTVLMLASGRVGELGRGLLRGSSVTSQSEEEGNKQEGRLGRGGGWLRMASGEGEGGEVVQGQADDDDGGIHRRIKSWVCIKQCGACCYLGTDEPDLQALTNEDERALYKSMIAPSGWCKHFDTEDRSCTIYETRPRFCRTEPEVFEDIFDVPKEEFVDAAIGSCLDAITHLYGDESQEFDRYQQVIDEGLPAEIEQVYKLKLVKRGCRMDIKGKGFMHTFFLATPAAALSLDANCNLRAKCCTVFK